MNDDFQLAREPAQKPPRVLGQFADQPATQKKLLGGLDCLPGQRDLIELDGDKLEER